MTALDDDQHRAEQPDTPRIPRSLEPMTLDDLGALELESSIECAEISTGDSTGMVVVDLPHSSWEAVSLSHASIAGADLGHALLTDVVFDGADCSNVELRGASMRRIRAARTRAVGIGLSEATIRNADFDEVAMDFARLRFAKLDRVRFSGCQLRDADFSSADLRSVVFEHCDLGGSDFTKTTFARCEIRSCTLDGIRGLGSLAGVAMPLEDVVELAPVFAAALGVHVIVSA